MVGGNFDYRYRNMAGNGPPNMGLPPGYMPVPPYVMPPTSQAQSVPYVGIPAPPPMPVMGFPPYMLPVSAAPPPVQPVAPPPSIPSAASTTNYSLPGGVGVVLPRALATVHVISANVQPWNNPGGTFNFQAYKIPPTMSVQEVIEQVCPSKGPQNQRVVSRGVVEIHEQGNGRWLKGQEFWLAEKGQHGDSDAMRKKISRPIAEYGWDEKRGSAGLPVWISCLQHYG